VATKQYGLEPGGLRDLEHAKRASVQDQNQGRPQAMRMNRGQMG